MQNKYLTVCYEKTGKKIIFNLALVQAIQAQNRVIKIVFDFENDKRNKTISYVGTRTNSQWLEDHEKEEQKKLDDLMRSHLAEIEYLLDYKDETSLTIVLP